MVTPAAGSPAVLVLSGGEVLLTAGDAVSQVLRGMRMAARAGRSDGVTPSPLVRELIAALQAGEFRQQNSWSSAELLDSGDVSGSSGQVEVPIEGVDDEIDVEEAAKLMRTSESNVRARCRRESLVARKSGGRWVVSRAEVLEAAARRSGSSEREVG